MHCKTQADFHQMCAVEEWHVQFLIVTAISTPQTEKLFLRLSFNSRMQHLFLFQKKKREHFQHLIAYFIGFFLITVIFNEINVLDIISTLFFCHFQVFTLKGKGTHRCHTLPIIIFVYSFLHLNPIFFCALQAWVLLYLKPHKFICFQNVFDSKIKHKKYELKKRSKVRRRRQNKKRRRKIRNVLWFEYLFKSRLVDYATRIKPNKLV